MAASASHPRSPRQMPVWPALVATVGLLILLLAGYTILESRRLQQNLAREMEERALAIIGVLEAGSRNAIATQSMLEEIVAQRLLDNARFVDFLVAQSPRARELIDRVVKENRLARVELLDREGQPVPLPQVFMPRPGAWTGRGHGGPGRPGFGPPEDTGASGTDPADRPRGPMMRGMMRPPEPEEVPGGGGDRPPGMPLMWGRRWGLRGDPSRLFPSLPKNARIRRFWEGSTFGVAVPAQSFSGAVVIHADAEYLLNFRKQIGLQPLIMDLAKQPGIVEVTLLDRDLTVVASSDDSTVDRIEQNPSLQDALKAKTAQARRRSCGADCEAVEVIKPFVLEQQEAGLIRLALNTASVTGVARQAQRGILWYSAGLLVVGVVGAVSIFWLQARHLSERRRLEAAVAQEQRLSAMGNLAAGVAHEIKNPLNAISMGLQRLRMEYAPAATEARQEFTQFTRIIEAEVARLNTIVNQFLTLARPLRLAMIEESLSSVVKDVLAILEPQAASQGVAFVQDLGRGDLHAPLDRQQFVQALMNILLNGIQAMPGGGTLTVRIEPGLSTHPRSGVATARVIIADTGPGIRPENLDRIFEPYFTTKEGGTGLGLALARRIVEEHGGRLRAENVPDGGARFVIDIPKAR